MTLANIFLVDLTKSPSEYCTKEDVKGSKIMSTRVFIFFSRVSFDFYPGSQAKTHPLRICPCQIHKDATNSVTEEFGNFTLRCLI